MCVFQLDRLYSTVARSITTSTPPSRNMCVERGAEQKPQICANLLNVFTSLLIAIFLCLYTSTKGTTINFLVWVLLYLTEK